MNSIPTDDRAYAKMIGKWSLRYLAATTDTNEEFDKFRRFERWWDQKSAEAIAGDEYAIMLGLGFSVVEGMHAKITEPLFQMGLPCDTYPRHSGDYAAAKKMQHVQRSYYQGPNFQEALGASKKSMCIVGHRFEFDEWLHIERDGKMWDMVPVKVEVPLVRRKDGTPDGDKTAKAITLVLAEVPVKVPVHYGFNTEFPRWHDIHCEPGRTTFDTGQKTDVSWVIRSLGDLTIEEMAKEVEYDVNSKSNKPRYDFSRLIHASGKAAEKRYQAIMDGKSGSVDNFGAVITPQYAWDYAGSRSDRKQQANALEDRDKISVRQCREMGEILTIAQDQFIIHRMPDPWHRPGLKVRIENYTTSGTGRLRGKGAIEPIESLLGEADDMHSMSMDNIFRVVHRMTYVRQDAIVSEDDFDPRAGGLVRIKSDVTDVRGAVSESSAVSPVNELRQVESELRGLIEKITGDLDGGSGEGIANANKTAKGLGIVVNNLSPLYSRFQRQARVNECRRCMTMAEMIEQFHFEKVSYRLVRPDGSTSFADFDRTDFDTHGRGFDFGYQMDPSWGNNQQRVQLKEAAYESGVAYMKIPKSIRGENSRDVNLDILYEDILQELGYTDTSAVFRAPDGSMSPEEELERLAQGGAVAGCAGDLMHHIQVHFLQLQSPQLKIAIEAKKANPDTPKNLQLLIMQAMAKMKTFMADPQGSATARLSKAGFSMPGPQSNPGAEAKPS